MRKTWIALAVAGWIAAGVLWYCGHKVTQERDAAWVLTGDIDFRLQSCMVEKAKAQSALQSYCYGGRSL